MEGIGVGVDAVAAGVQQAVAPVLEPDDAAGGGQPARAGDRHGGRVVQPFQRPGIGEVHAVGGGGQAQVGDVVVGRQAAVRRIVAGPGGGALLRGGQGGGAAVVAVEDLLLVDHLQRPAAGDCAEDAVRIQQPLGVEHRYRRAGRRLVGRRIAQDRRTGQRQSALRRQVVDHQVGLVDIAGGADQGIQIGVAGDLDDELVPLSVVVAVVAVVGEVEGIAVLAAVRLLVELVGAGGAQLQHLLLEGPGVAGVIGHRGGHRLVGVFRTPVEVALQMPAFADHHREVVRLHPLGARIADLVAAGVAIAGGFQAVGGAGLLQRPRPAGDHRLGRRAFARPAHTAVPGQGRQRQRGSQGDRYERQAPAHEAGKGTTRFVHDTSLFFCGPLPNAGRGAGRAAIMFRLLRDRKPGLQPLTSTQRVFRSAVPGRRNGSPRI